MQVEVLKSKNGDDRLYIDGDLICENLRQVRKFTKFLYYCGYKKMEEVELSEIIVDTYEK